MQTDGNNEYENLSRDELIREILELKKEQKSRKLHEDSFHILFEHTEIATAIVSLDGHIIKMNEAAYLMLGYERDKLNGVSIEDITYPGDYPISRESITEVIKNEKPKLIVEKRYLHKNGRIVWALVNSTLIRDETGTPYYWISQIQDITEKKFFQQALLETERTISEKENYYRTILYHLHEDVVVIDRDYKIIDINGSVLQTTGQKREDVVGHCCGEVFHGSNHMSSNCIEFACPGETRTVFETGEPALSIHQHRHTNGSTVFVDIYSTPIKDADGNVIYVVKTMRDITDYRNAEEKSKKSLQEKELLLKEIHHRVKNNMAIISSLLLLQANAANDERLDSILNLSIQRIRTISMIHEQLYKTDDFTSIDFNNYIRVLTNYIMRLAETSNDNINVELNVKDIFMEIGKAVPCGLIINELVTNALKYAFPEQNRGTLLIEMVKLDSEIPDTLTKANQAYYRLSISDDGVGFPKNFNLKKTPSFGLYLVNLLTEQLKGKIELKQGKEGKIGSTITITFPCA